jgi:hypothetical protein
LNLYREALAMSLKRQWVTGPVSIRRGTLGGRGGLLFRMHKVWLGILIVGIVTLAAALAAAMKFFL